MHFRSSAVEIKGQAEIDAMREVSRLAAETLSAVGEIVRPGLTTDEINSFVHNHTLKQGARPAPLNYKGFPKSVCTSINEVVCHGIPSERALRDGDIINID
ncbi:MAG TPA: M24 family metallopeptidase, partial [Polyangiaceae bacterium]|nr:M24 family metallopeptidase [Polyangiaceae bacterium]